MALRDKQRVFINEYLKCWNATEAARRAGYSEKYLNTNANKLLQNTTVKAEIENRLKEIQSSADEVLILLTDHARGNIDDFLTFSPGVKLPVLDLAKAHQNGKMHLVKKLKYSKDGTIEFELYDAQAAAEKLGRHHNLFKESVEHSGEVGLKVEFVNDWRGNSE